MQRLGGTKEFVPLVELEGGPSAVSALVQGRIAHDEPGVVKKKGQIVLTGVIRNDCFSLSSMGSH